jgi:hypothetical protein
MRTRQKLVDVERSFLSLLTRNLIFVVTSIKNLEMAHSVQTFSKKSVIMQFNARVAARISRCRHPFSLHVIEVPFHEFKTFR